jgi:hypothetical protein
MRRHPIVICVLFAALLTLTPLLALAQQETPSPAPSKTATEIATISVSTEVPAETESESEIAESDFKPWTQSDLSVLTGNVQRPNGLSWHNGKLYIVCNGDFTVYEVDDTTGATRAYIFGVRNAHAIHTETDDNNELTLWIPDFEANLFVNVTRLGVTTVVRDLEGPWGISYLNDSDFLITNLRGNSLVVVNREGDVRELLTDLRSPTGVANDDGFIYFANTGSARRAIEWVSKDILAEGAALSPEPLVTGLQNVTGVTLAPDGKLYFAYSLGTRGVIGRVDPEQCRKNGGCQNDEVEIVVFTELASPLAGVTFSPDMRLFIHTMFSPDIYWVQLEEQAQSSES